MSSQANASVEAGNSAAATLSYFGGAKESRADSDAKTGKKWFEPGTYAADGTFVFVRNPAPSELLRSYQMLVAEVGPDVAPLGAVQAVYARNSLAWWTIHRSANDTRMGAETVGLCAYLPLNAEGFAALKTCNLVARDPDLRFITPNGEDPVALYLWAIVAHGLSDLAGKLVGHAIGLDLYERLPMFGTIGTEAGLAALRRSTKSATEAAQLRIGSPFEIKLPPHHLQHQREMEVFEGTPSPPQGARGPSEQSTRPPFREAFRAANGNGRTASRTLRLRLETRVASDADDIARIFALRAAVFMAEQECPYEEEFDGNDYCGTHILGLVNGEPAATLRIRYFADFVKIERLAVLPRFRRTLITREVVGRGIAPVRRKGYTQMYGQSQLRLVNFWRKFGFEPRAKNNRLVFSDHEYVEIVGTLDPHTDRLTMHSDPYTLIRTEGRWDEPGVLDKSAVREATNPW